MRSCSLSSFLRRRIWVGVISAYSSSLMYSMARSRVIGAIGVRFRASSDPEARTLVSFLFLRGFTDRSFPRFASPMIIPSYTSTAGPIKSGPRSWSFHREYAMVGPVNPEIMEPTVRFWIGPICGAK